MITWYALPISPDVAAAILFLPVLLPVLPPVRYTGHDYRPKHAR